MIRSTAQLAFDRDDEREHKSSVPTDFARLGDDWRVHPTGSSGQEVTTEPRTCFRCTAPATSTWACPTGRVEFACADHACCGNRCRHCPNGRAA